MPSIYSKILKEEFGIVDHVSAPLGDMNKLVTEEQIKRHNLMTTEMFKKFQIKVINTKLP